MEKRFEVKLRMFDGEGEAGGEKTTEVKVTQADIEAWKKTEEGKKYFQSITDGAVTKGLKTWQENNLSKYVEKDVYDKVVSESKAKIEEITISTEIHKNLAGFKYPELIAAQIKKENLKVTENGIVGLNEEIERVKKAYPDLIAQSGQQKVETKGGIPSTTKKTEGELSKEEIEKMPMKERLAYKQKLMKENKK